jgi:hypothetical protein
MKLMLLTADPIFAAKAQEVGVDRIFLDLEYINKVERQKGRNTVISQNSVEDVLPLRRLLNRSELLVRINPINPHTEEEVERVVADGADILMLPMVIDEDDVRTLVKIVKGRARVCPMVETSQAFVRLDNILAIRGIDEIFIGLNDLHISMNLVFMFELLSGGIVEYMARKLKVAGIPFGFGGLAKMGEGLLPAEYVLGEHYRLGSSSVILSRTFRNEVGNNAAAVLDLSTEITKLRECEHKIEGWSAEEFEKNRKIVQDNVRHIVRKLVP